MNYPKVSVIILNWNGLDDTVECLESLRNITYSNYEVIVVDNGSKGNDAQLLREKFCNYIHLIACDRNYGFAGGVNIGIRYILNNTLPDYLLLLNNDTIVDPNFLDELVRVAETDERIGIVGPKIYYYSYKGENNVIWFAGGKIYWWHPWIYHHIGQHDDDLPKYDKVINVDWITGAALMFKCCLIDQVGILNSSYFLGHEDVEYCLEAWRCGFKVVYAPSAKVWHKVGASGRDYYYPTLADPSPYYQFIRRNFSLSVYIYHLLNLPILLLGASLIYLIRYKDVKLIRRVLLNFTRFALQRHKRTLDY